MENKPLGIPNQNYEVWKKIVELRKTYLQDLKPANVLLGRDSGLYVIDGDFYIK